MKFNNEKLVSGKTAVSNVFEKITNYLSKVSPFDIGVNDKELFAESSAFAKEITSASLIFDNIYVPNDRKRTQVRTILSASGIPISSLCLPQDWAHGDENQLKKIPYALMMAGVITAAVTSSSLSAPVLAGAIGIGAYLASGATVTDSIKAVMMAGASYYLYKTFGNADSLMGLAPLLAPSLLMYGSAYTVKKLRDMEILKQGRIHNAIIADNQADIKLINEQTIQATEDDAKNPSIEIAFASGGFQLMGNFSSPDANTVLRMNLSDMAQHMFVMGKPGTGKSYFLRQIIKQMHMACKSINREIGMLLMDGKGELANECKKILDLYIHPEHVTHFNLIDGVDATKWTTIIQAINNVKMDGPNAEFMRAALELIYNAALTHILLKDIRDADPSILPDFKWNYMYRYNLMGKLLESGYERETSSGKKEWVKGSGEIIAEILSYHPNYETDPRVRQLITSIESELTPERQEFAMKYMKTAQGYMQAVLQSESIIKWANSETTDINVLDCLKGKKIGIGLPPERFGAAGLLVTQLVKGKVRNAIANRENNWRDDKEATELLFVQDEFQDLFSESDDLNNIPKDRSRGCYNIVSTQTLSAIYAKVQKNELANYLLANFGSFVSLKTDDKIANEFMQNLCGSVTSFSVLTNKGPAIAFKETANNLIYAPEYNPEHPNASMFKKLRGNVKFKYKPANQTAAADNPHGMLWLIESILSPFMGIYDSTFGMFATSMNNEHTHFISTYQKDEKKETQKLFPDHMFQKLDQKCSAVIVYKRGGNVVKDIALLKGVDPNFVDAKL